MNTDLAGSGRCEKCGQRLEESQHPRTPLTAVLCMFGMLGVIGVGLAVAVILMHTVLDWFFG